MARAGRGSAPARSYAPATLPSVPEELIAHPPELHPYRRAFDEATAALDAYVAQVEAACRAEYPDPGGRWDEVQAALRTAAWTPEQHAEVQRLRDGREAARKALWERPAHEAGRKSGDWKRWKPLDAAE